MRALANEIPPRSRRHRRAGTVVLARIDSTGVVFPFAIVAHEVPGAIAGVSIDAIDASTTVLARLQQTFVHVDLTVLSCKKCRFLTKIIILKIMSGLYVRTS